MIIWIVRIIAVLAGPLIGYYQVSRTTQGLMIGLLCSFIVILAEIIIHRIPLDTLIAAILGTILGLVGAKLLDYTVYLMDNPRIYELMKDYSLLIKVVFAYLGLVIAVQKKSELDLLDRDIFRRPQKKGQQELIVLDTSAIIDGRIADITSTKFLSGVLVIPRFILEELQTLADSGDAFKRNRARRGLDIIAQLQKEEGLNVKIVDKDYPELHDADAKLLQMAKELTAKVITTDFNLNKVGVLQGITVLNINDLSNALKPVYLPGETMPIFVVKEGKEHNQGVGYLDDGTMVVVEEGRKLLGKRHDVIVTSILQTSSGRMIFTKPLSDTDNGHHAK
ncbi:MAG TPA: PIN domain nuclease [Elusimicrobia bacterium]|nr:PIN domain nuclease [Elusimicrobiota bacterium]